MKKKDDQKKAATSENYPSPVRERPLEPKGVKSDLSNLHRRAEAQMAAEDIPPKDLSPEQEDIAQRAQVKAALRESEERFRLAFENANIGMALVGLDGSYLQVNQALSNMLGYSRDELENMKVRDLTHPDDLPVNRDFWRRALHGEVGSTHFEKKKTHKDGTVVWVHIASSLVRDSQGEPLYFVSQVQDITARKRAEEALHRAHDELEQRVQERTTSLRLANEQLLWEIAERQRIQDRLRESEARFTAFMEHLPGQATMRDMEGRYLFANLAWEEMMNLKRGAWQGKPLAEIWPEKQAAALQKLDFEIIASGKPTEQVEKMEQEDGLHHLLTHRFPILDGEGLPFMVGSIAIDITARLRAEKALAAERQRFLDLLEHLPAYIYLQAPDYSMRFANRKFRERFGVPNGKTCYTLLWGRDEPCPDCPTFKVFNTGQPNEWELSAPDGRVYQVYDYPFVDLDGSPLVLEMGIDITDRKKAEVALNASEIRLRYLADQLLMAQENERKRLAAELHDELGHALLTLKLHLSSIEKKMLPEQEDLKEEMRSQLDYINEVIQEVRRLYHDLSPGDVEDLGLTKALRNLIKDFAGYVPEITWQVDLVDLEGLFSSPVQTIIYRTMQEALTNIGKHGHPDAVTISTTKEPDQVHFVVQDNGKGFNVQDLGSHGTVRGLGLVAMEERLNMIGGSLEIQSREQQGTRLSFTIPTLPEGEKL